MLFAHISDLHFNSATNIRYADSLAKDITSVNPKLIVSTGDITDRGRRSQYKQAIRFLESLNIPWLSVPGNREIAISAFWELLFPKLAMGRYRSHLGQSDRIVHPVGDTVFIGVNSVHPFPSWPGNLKRATRYWLKEQLPLMQYNRKVLFLHHPVIPVVRASSFWAHTLSDAGAILTMCAENGVSLILQGHKHRSAVAEITYPQLGGKIIISCGGAPLSDRWDQSYHIIELGGTEITIRIRSYVEGAFRETGRYSFSSP